jgi:hypothetical protein
MSLSSFRITSPCITTDLDLEKTVNRMVHTNIFKEVLFILTNLVMNDKRVIIYMFGRINRVIEYQASTYLGR